MPTRIDPPYPDPAFPTFTIQWVNIENGILQERVISTFEPVFYPGTDKIVAGAIMFHDDAIGKKIIINQPYTMITGEDHEES